MPSINANSQYDADSAPNQNYNCGPTTVTNIVRFHRDRDFRINDTRRLATSRNYTGTTTSERRTMAERRGVPAEVRHLTAAQVKSLLNGRRAIDLALLMGKIPLSIRKRPFAGSHSVLGIERAVKDGVTGIIVYNPDYHRDRDQPSRYFYPDKYWVPAFTALGGWAVVPENQKVIVTRIAYRRKLRTTAGVNLRSGPGTQYTRRATVPAGFTFTSVQLEKAGGAYKVGATTRRDWLSLSYNGRLVWVARGFCREI
jgi:hypothetical protein